MSLHQERITKLQSAGLYVVTSEVMSAGRTSRQIIESILPAGAKLIQLREKDLPYAELRDLARWARKATAEAGALLIINDNVELALEVGADGVHLGQEDMDVAVARAMDDNLVIGSSTHNVEEALEAKEKGASYINIGPLFPTGTKQWNDAYLGLDGLREISSKVSIPFTVMGGIKEAHIGELVAAGARTIAVVTAVTAANDPGAAAAALLEQIVTAGEVVE